MFDDFNLSADGETEIDGRKNKGLVCGKKFSWWKDGKKFGLRLSPITKGIVVNHSDYSFLERLCLLSSKSSWLELDEKEMVLKFMSIVGRS